MKIYTITANHLVLNSYLAAVNLAARLHHLDADRRHELKRNGKIATPAGDMIEIKSTKTNKVTQ